MYSKTAHTHMKGQDEGEMKALQVYLIYTSNFPQ